MSNPIDPDVVLVGGGIMSATLAVLLKELQPELTIQIFEGLPQVAEESSRANNNAGTGHAALCELNYTPERADGSVDWSKAVKINEAFTVSEQFWSYLVQKGRITTPRSFVNRVPHLSFVWGDENARYLRTRYEAMRTSHLFEEMEFSEDHQKLKEWMPLIMESRDPKEKLAANYVQRGTDVDFGSLTRNLIKDVVGQPGVQLHLNHEVLNVRRAGEGRWNVRVRDKATNNRRIVNAKFVFLGAGGGALPLLQKSGIEEGKGYGGFPVSGQWLRCKNQELINKHYAKVYGKASVGAPPMSVPHLDTRVIDGQKALLFGPYAGFSTKFLKSGSLLDMPLSIKLDNIIPMLAAGLHNIDLTKYLIGQVLQTPEQRLAALREFLPQAKLEDWDLEIAGQRVQVIKKDPKVGGVLQFGTEVICSADGSIAALLGASPGASSAVSIMVDVITSCFKDKITTPAWQSKIKEMIPSYGQSLAKDKALSQRIRALTTEALALD